MDRVPEGTQQEQATLLTDEQFVMLQSVLNLAPDLDPLVLNRMAVVKLLTDARLSRTLLAQCAAALGEVEWQRTCYDGSPVTCRLPHRPYHWHCQECAAVWYEDGRKDAHELDCIVGNAIAALRAAGVPVPTQEAS